MMFQMRRRRFGMNNPISANMDNKFLCWMLNVSGSGCLLVTSAWQEINDKIHTLDFSLSEKQKLSVSARIVRARLIPYRNTAVYEVGMAFHERCFDEDELNECLIDKPSGESARTTFRFAHG